MSSLQVCAPCGAGGSRARAVRMAHLRPAPWSWRAKSRSRGTRRCNDCGHGPITFAPVPCLELRWVVVLVAVLERGPAMTLYHCHASFLSC